MEEIEVKFLDIDARKIEKRLLRLGAIKKYDRIFKDRVFDFPELPLDENKSWLRLRDKGDKITLTYKHRIGTSSAGDASMEEVEVVVDDFETTSQLLERIGMIQKFNEEKRRIHFELKGVDIDIDTFPLIPSYVEIEGKSWDEVEEIAHLLELEWNKRKQFSTMQLLRLHGIEEKDYAVLTFDKQVKR